jgi:predicted nucleotidyltransferase
MFTAAERDAVRTWLVSQAQGDEGIVAAAITGSFAADAQDEWSDIDIFFGVADETDRAAVVEDWTKLLDREFGVVHHWDLASPATTYRVFLLPSGLEVDIGFTSQSEFAAVGLNFRVVFGEHVTREPQTAPTREEIGLGWHHVFHARACIERRKPRQAEWLINGIRDHVVTLACVRLGLPAYFARGADQLPAKVRAALEPARVRSLDADELRRALAAATEALLAEVREHDAELAGRLEPLLRSAT